MPPRGSALRLAQRKNTVNDVMNSCERREIKKESGGLQRRRQDGKQYKSSAGNGWVSALMGGEGGGFASRRTDMRNSEVQINPEPLAAKSVNFP